MCAAKLQLPQQPVACRRHSIVRCQAAGATSAGVEAAAAAAAGAEQQPEQQQSSSNHQVIDVDDLADGNGNADSSSGSSSPDVVVKALSGTEELQAVARLRAEAYYAVSSCAKFQHMLNSMHGGLMYVACVAFMQ
jgi:hypothetical protein